MHCDCHSLFIDDSDMTSPNSLIFLILVRVSQRHTLDAEALEWVKLIVSFKTMLKFKKKKLMGVYVRKLELNCVFMSTCFSFQSPLLFSAELTIQKYCLLSDSLFPSA